MTPSPSPCAKRSARPRNKRPTSGRARRSTPPTPRSVRAPVPYPQHLARGQICTASAAGKLWRRVCVQAHYMRIRAEEGDMAERVSQWRTLGAHIIGRLSGRGGQVRPNARAPRLACTGSSGRVSGVRVLRCGAGRGADAHRLQRGLVDRLAQPPLAAVVSERVPWCLGKVARHVRPCKIHSA